MSAQRQVGLDAVRGLAILLVLFFHFNQPVGVALVDALLTPFRTAGWAGVELFFVLSGYLVGGIILTESAAPGGFDRSRFMLRRILRLWPILYLYVAALALGGVEWNGIWPVLLHVQNYSDPARSHLWSLAVEEHFYILAALALPWLVRTGSPRRLSALLVALIVVVTMMRPVALMLGASMPHVQSYTHFRIDALAMGVLLAVIRHYRPDWFIAAQRHRPLLVLAAVVGFAVLALDLSVLRRWGGDLTLAALTAVPLVVAVADVAVTRRFERAVRALAWLGLIAYPLYIWHIFVGNVAVMLAGYAGIKASLLLAVLWWTSAIAFAAVLHRAVEAPFMALRDRLGWLASPRRNTELVIH